MEAVASYTQFIEKHLTQLDFPSAPSGLYDPLHYFMTMGGKRMRPVLTILAAELFGVQKEESIAAGLCVELFHNFSLIHDDIMDEAPVRRGKTTVHTKWNSNTAILSGDVLFVNAYRQLAKYADDRLPKLLKCFNETVIEVCEGQQMDMDFESRTDVNEEEYITMIRLKTSVLLGCSLELGALLGRQNAEISKKLYDFGVKLGIAFQIQDDILDLYGNPETFGKQIGGDVLCNKQTLLFIRARSIAKEQGDDSFDQLVAMNSSPEKVQVAVDLFQKNGALEATNKLMEQYYSEALSLLEALEKEHVNVTVFRKIAQNLMVRIR